MESLGNRVYRRLANDKKKFQWKIKYRSYKKSVAKLKKVLTLNKPAYLDLCLLNLGKTLTYNFYF